MRSKLVSLLLVVLLVSSVFAGGVMAQEGTDTDTQQDDSQQQDGQEDGSQSTDDGSDDSESSSSDGDSDGSDDSDSSSSENDSDSSDSSSEANENEINTDRVVKTIGDGAVVVHDVRTYNDRVEIDLSTNRYQTIVITKSYENSWDNDVHTVGSGTHTIVVNDVSGVKKLGVGVNQQGKYVKVNTGTTLLPQINSVLALLIGVVVVFVGLFVKAKKRDSDKKQKIEVMR